MFGCVNVANVLRTCVYHEALKPMLVPVRKLGAVGVNTDVDTLALPPEAFSTARNARFNSGVITRGPVFKTCGPLSVNKFPRHIVSYFKEASENEPSILLCNDNGTIHTWVAGTGYLTSTTTDISIAGYTPASSTSAFTHCVINGIVYVNRPDRVPWYLAATASATVFQELPVWDSTWRCKSLRAFAGSLVAINLIKGSTLLPTTVKTSDYMVYGTTPGSWTASPSNASTENVLDELFEPLIDGAALRDRFFLYSGHETWIMEPTGDNQVYSYRRIFKNRGTINQNCIIERDNKHYVFGLDDIWVHDGFNEDSIAESRVRQYIFGTADLTQTSQFFTMHNQRESEIYFCYVSRDLDLAYPVAAYGITDFPGCNCAAVYNYDDDTWSFCDLPYVTHMNLGVTTVPKTWDQYTSTAWSSLPGVQWLNLTSNRRLSVISCSPEVTGVPTFGTVESAVRSFESFESPFSEGNVDESANAQVYLENKYINLDQLTSEIRGYKVVTSVYVNAHFPMLPHEPLTFQLGAADYSTEPAPVYSQPMTFDGSTNYKLDYVNAGRYLALKITYDDVKPFSLSGIDIDFTITGHR